MFDNVIQVKAGELRHDAFVVNAEAYAKLLEAYRESQRELRNALGLKALKKNGMPQTGDQDFDTVLATFPIAEMIQREWLPGIVGFDELDHLRDAICRFFRVATIAEVADPALSLKAFPRPIIPR